MPALDLAALVLDRVLRLGEMVGTFAFVFDRVFKFGEMEGSFSFGAAFFFSKAVIGSENDDLLLCEI